MTSLKRVDCTKTIVALVVTMFAANVPSAMAIKKCQDADGNWHYGDIAVKECERSKITTLNNRGFIKDEDEAPKSKEELAAEREAREAEEKEKEEEMKRNEERNRILNVYQSEADIDRQRDNQLYSVDSSIAVHEIYIKGLKAKRERLEEKQQEVKEQYRGKFKKDIEESTAKIEDSEKELEALKVQRKHIEEKFAREKEVYLTLKAEVSSES
jgi:chromosome segregation ATPase